MSTSPSPADGSAPEWTVGRIIDWTTSHLKKHGSDTPRLDTEILLAHVRGCPRIKLYTEYTVPLTDDERVRMRELVKRRAQAEPVAYLVGHREFFGLDFRVSKEVLIPRPDTETLVVELLERIPVGGTAKILDLCTGSGCIAMTVAVNRPQSQVVATDISPGALEVARGNAEKLRLGERVTLLEGDLFSAVPPGNTFDFIVSNPPYIPTPELATLDADVRCHEPLLALDGGPVGMTVLERIIAEAPRYLKPGGWLLLETGIEQAPLTHQALENAGGWGDIQTVKDMGGRPRVTLARKG